MHVLGLEDTEGVRDTIVTTSLKFKPCPVQEILNEHLLPKCLQYSKENARVFEEQISYSPLRNLM